MYISNASVGAYHIYYYYQMTLSSNQPHNPLKWNILFAFTVIIIIIIVMEFTFTFRFLFRFFSQPSAFSLGDLHVPQMANVLKVFLENGQTKSFKYDSTTTVRVSIFYSFFFFHFSIDKYLSNSIQFIAM